MNKNNLKGLTKKTVQDAERHLRKSDRIMKGLIESHGSCPLFEYEYRPFHTLVVSIISQQLSAKAAGTIKGRIAKITSEPFMPEDFLSVSADKLRNAGLSSSKARYIKELACRASDGRLSFDRLKLEEDGVVIERLIELPGIGHWTAEMFLIFGLKRPDVLSLRDAGLQRAAKTLYGGGQGDSDLLEKISESWCPYRSIASWYLWKYLDT